MDFLSELSKNDYFTLENQRWLDDRHLQVQSIKNAFVLPVKYVDSSRYNGPIFGVGGVLDDEEKYMECSAQVAVNMRDRVYGGYAFNKDEVHIVHQSVIYMNYYIHQWGHFLLDVINRLWYALENENVPIVYTCMLGTNDKISGNYLELLKLMGIDPDRLILVNEVTQFDNVMIPEASLVPGKYFTKEYSNLFSLIVSKCCEGKHDYGKIYCSRSMLKQDKDLGEEKIETIYNENGYKSVHLEKLSLREQIQLLNGADAIAMINGSLAHNLLFVQSRPTVTILNKTYRVNLHQFLVNSISNAEIVYVDVYVAPMPVLYGRGPFLIRVTPEFTKYANYMRFDMKKVKVNTRLTFFDKVNYYIKWAYYYKWYILRHKKIEEGGFDKDYHDIRQEYRKAQK